MSCCRVEYSPDYLPSVSVIVPAFNEKKVICRTIDSLLRSDYSNLTIIVVDDGSTDGTYQCVVEAFKHNPLVCVFTKNNSGKSEALNYGVKQTDAEIIVTVDADTLLLPNAISLLIRHFADRNVGSVAGNIKVGNPINLLTYWQALEYINYHNLERRAFNLLNCICIVPGAIGAWQKHLQSVEYSKDALHLVLFAYILLLAVDFIRSLIALILDKEDWRLLIWVLPQRYFFQYIHYYLLLKSIATGLQGKNVGWGKLERKATVR